MTMSEQELKKQAEDFFGPPDEPLLPELEKYLSERGTLGQILQHPLVYQVPYFPQLAHMSNRMYRHKLEYLDEATREQNWHQVIWLYERPYRLHAFLTIQDKLTDNEYWEILHLIWIDSENIWQNIDDWVEALSSPRRAR